MTSPHVIDSRLIDFDEGRPVVQVDTRKSTYNGMPWRTLSGYQKGKFENMVIAHHPEHQAVKVVYKI